MTETSVSGKLVYKFREGNKSMKALLGGKGANLAEMTTIGLPVPPGFTITTEVCNLYSASCTYPDGLTGQVDEALADLEKDTGKRFGDPQAVHELQRFGCGARTARERPIGAAQRKERVEEPHPSPHLN